MSYFLFGYNGLGNIGDDLMFESLINKLPKNETIFSYKRNYTIGNEIGTTGLKLIFKIFFSDTFVVVGGNVFSYERTKSYLKVFCYIVLFYLRDLLGKKNVIDSVGLDLKESTFWRSLVLAGINLCHSVSIRDSLSYRYIRRNARSSLCVLYEYDRVFREREYIRGMLKDNKDVSAYELGHLMWWVSAPAYKKNAEKDDILKIYSKLVSRFEKVIFLCQGKCDADRALEIARRLRITSYLICNYDYNKKEEAINILINSALIITERYHGAVLAEVFCKKWQPIPFSEKLSRIKPCMYKTNEIFSD